MAQNSSPHLRLHRELTFAGAMCAVEAGLTKASEIGVAQNIAVVDAGGNLIAFARMDGARTLARHSAISKAQTAASLKMASGHLPSQFGVDLAFATEGLSINLIGGLPIEIDGEVVGAIGVSSGTDDEDLAVAKAARDAV